MLCMTISGGRTEQHVIIGFGELAAVHGRRNRGVWGGDNVPLTFGTRGVQGVQVGGPMKMIFASTADSFYSVLYK